MRRRPGAAARWRDWRTAYLILIPLLVVLGVLIYYPALSTLWDSFRQLDFHMPTVRGWAGVHNYVQVLASGEFWASVRRSFVVVVIVLPIELFVGLAGALLLNEDFPGRAIVRTVSILPWFLPPIVIGFMWGWILNGQYGALNGLLYQLGFIRRYHDWLLRPAAQIVWVSIAQAWTRYPFPLIILLAGLQGIPEEVHDAATVDGVSAWQRFRFVTFPLLRPSFAISVVVEFIFAFQVFDVIWSLTGGGAAGAVINPYTKTLMLYNYQVVFSNLNLGAGSALSYLILVLTLVVGLSFLRVLQGRQYR